MTDEELAGILVVDKPEGPTSHDVVDRIRRLFEMRRVGHAGTLDPMATGVLIIGVGKATRLLGFLKDLPKRYTARVRFGLSTTTQDVTGSIEIERKCKFSEEDLLGAAQSFIGEISQTPPMVSAVRVGGRRLYEEAREGREVERAPRKVRVHSLEMKDVDLEKWEASMEVLCSSGTYVRTLAADLGESLGCGAHLASLRRNAIGSFTEDSADTLDELEQLNGEGRRASLLDMTEGMRDFPQVRVAGDEETAVRHGRPLEIDVPPVRSRELPVVLASRAGQLPPHQAGMAAGIPVAVVGVDGGLLAVYRRSRNGLRPAAVLV